jgi:hypothetical protein
MVGVGLEAGEAVGDDRVGDALDALASESETPGDHRDAEPAGRGDPHHLPSRLGLSGELGGRLAVAAQRAGEFEHFGDQGLHLDVALGGVAKIFLFFVLFLVVRGTPALLLYRDVLNRGERYSLALLSSTQLPFVVAITALATSSGHMPASTATALVGAALLSPLVFPMLGLRIAKRAHDPGTARADADHPALAPDAAG